jgi:hypothetical protein
MSSTQTDLAKFFFKSHGKIFNRKIEKLNYVREAHLKIKEFAKTNPDKTQIVQLMQEFGCKPRELKMFLPDLQQK